MKKTTLVLLFALFATGTLSAQRKANESFRTRFINLTYSSQTMAFKDVTELGTVDVGASKFGMGLSMGRSFILHKKPIGGMFRIGIDATWIDLNYGYWNRRMPLLTTQSHKSWMHKTDVGLGVGLGLHLNPVSRLGIHAYCRYNPTFSMLLHNMLLDETEIDGGYASYFTTGGAISWGVISLGVEARFGGGTYHTLNTPEVDFHGGIYDDDFRIEIDNLFDKQKHKLKGLRAYVNFRF
jgi:hypothetical protein